MTQQCSCAASFSPSLLHISQTATNFHVLHPCRERLRAKNNFQQSKLGEYEQTVEKLEQVNLYNQQLEAEQQRLQAEFEQLQVIRPSAPSLSNGASDSDSNHSSNEAAFTARTQRKILLEPARAVAYRKTEQAWFAKVRHATHESEMRDSSCLSTISPCATVSPCIRSMHQSSDRGAMQQLVQTAGSPALSTAQPLLMASI